MTASRLFTDEELTAYLDQESDPKTAEVITHNLETDPVLQSRVQQLNALSDDFSTGFDKLLACAPMMPELDRADAGPFTKHWHIPVGLVAVLAIGIVFGIYSPQRSSPKGWMEYVSAYQALYVGGTLSSVAFSDGEKTAQLKDLGRILGRDLTTAQDADGIEFRRAQLLGFEGRPLVQMAFMSQIGSPIALCVIQSNGEVDAEPRLTTFEGMSASFWTKDGYSFLLIGGIDDGLIARETKYFFDTI